MWWTQLCGWPKGDNVLAVPLKMNFSLLWDYFFYFRKHLVRLMWLLLRIRCLVKLRLSLSPNEFRLFAFPLQVDRNVTICEKFFSSERLIWRSLFYHSMLLIHKLHSYSEFKGTATIDTGWVDEHASTTLLHNLLYYSEAQTNSIAVHYCRPMQLAKLSEQLRDVLLCNT